MGELGEHAGSEGTNARADRHPDPAAAEAIRWQICEGELVQIIGRVRGIDRTAANPADVLVLTNAVLPLPIDHPVADADLDPSPYDLMLADGGMAFHKPADAFAAYLDLWPSANAAKEAMRRWEARRAPSARPADRCAPGDTGTNPYRDLFIGKCTRIATTVTISYMLPGSRSPGTACCSLADVADPAARITELLGAKPKWCNIEGPEPPMDGAEPQPPAAEHGPATRPPLPARPIPAPKPLTVAMHAESTMVATLTAYRPLGANPPAPQRPP